MSMYHGKMAPFLDCKIIMCEIRRIMLMGISFLL